MARADIDSREKKPLCSGEIRDTEKGLLFFLWHPVIACLLIPDCVLIPDYILDENGLHCPNLAMDATWKAAERVRQLGQLCLGPRAGGALEAQISWEAPQCPHHSLRCFLPPTPACSGHLHSPFAAWDFPAELLFSADGGAGAAIGRAGREHDDHG